ncbi:MAG: PIN domain-containing protein [Chitinophagales bacterium]|nr:PIN domain-containing protein [Chitinophagales bacterium]
MKIFVDANILVSVVKKEYPLFSFTARIISLSDTNKFEIYTSPICLAIAYYFAEKKSGEIVAKNKIGLLSQHLKTTIVDGNTVKKSLQNKKKIDFEDGLQYYAAMDAQCKCIITQDIDDYYFSKMEVLTAQQFIAKHVV